MLIPMLWTAIVAFVTAAGVMTWYDEGKTEYQVAAFVMILATGQAVAALLLCLAVGM